MLAACDDSDHRSGIADGSDSIGKPILYPMDIRIPSPEIKILLESNSPESRILIRRLAAPVRVSTEVTLGRGYLWPS